MILAPRAAFTGWRKGAVSDFECLAWEDLLADEESSDPFPDHVVLFPPPAGMSAQAADPHEKLARRIRARGRLLRLVEFVFDRLNEDGLTVFVRLANIAERLFAQTSIAIAKATLPNEPIAETRGGSAAKSHGPIELRILLQLLADQESARPTLVGSESCEPVGWDLVIEGIRVRIFAAQVAQQMGSSETRVLLAQRRPVHIELPDSRAPAGAIPARGSAKIRINGNEIRLSIGMVRVLQLMRNTTSDTALTAKSAYLVLQLPSASAAQQARQRLARRLTECGFSILRPYGREWVFDDAYDVRFSGFDTAEPRDD